MVRKNKFIMGKIKKFEELFESFDGEAMYHSGAVTKNYARMMDYNNQNPAIELEEEINERDSWTSRNGETFKVGDVIDGSRLDELSGDMVGHAVGKYKLVQQDLSIFPDDEYNRQIIFDDDPHYIEEETYRFDSIKLDFDKTPPIPEEGDGMHRIIIAKELGHKTILMWKKIDDSIDEMEEVSQYTFKDLEKILLDEAGEKVTERLEEDLVDLIKHGDFFELEDYEYEVVPMRQSQCHANSATFYSNFVDDTNNSEDEIAICTGWALSNGMWVQHSWIYLLFDDIIIETTEPRDLYYGIILNREDTNEFLYNNM
jgi:hypothetical protein